MRTTLDIDDDVLLAAKEHAARDRRSVGAVISTLAREALRRPAGVRDARRKPAGGRFAILPHRDEIVTVEHVRRLQDDEGI